MIPFPRTAQWRRHLPAATRISAPCARVALVAVVAVVAGGGALSACSSDEAEQDAPPGGVASSETKTSSSSPQTSSFTSEAEPALAVQLPATRREQLASLLMPGVINYDDALAKLKAGAGGIFITSWADPELLQTPGRDIHALRAAVGRDFDVSIDFEGGRVQRFSEILGDFPTPRDMAAGGTAEAERQGFVVGQTLSAHGITVDFAPVIDVDGGGLNVVGDRSFSPDPFAAGELGAAFARGLHDAGVRPVFKHYPGHGRASGDTHQEMAITPPLDQLVGYDLVPFDVALSQSPGAGVMVGHLVVPGLGDGVTPASLNNHAYGLLREHAGFRGLTYTDDLTGMKAITDRMSPEEAVTASLAAGADQALWSTAVDFQSVLNHLEAAVDAGQLPPERVAESALRVAESHTEPEPAPGADPGTAPRAE